LNPDGSGEAPPTRRSMASRRASQSTSLLLWAALIGCSLPAAWGQAAPPKPAPPTPASAAAPKVVLADTLDEAARESLLVEVRKYTQLLTTLRDSLQEVEREGLGDQRAGKELDLAFEELGGAISELSDQLSGLNLDIGDQSISLRDRNGGGIQIDIPENLGEQISRGLSSITAAILSELPDTLDLQAEARRLPEVLRVRRPVPPRRVRSGDAIKLWDDILVDEDEEIHGNVVVVFGNAMVAGRVDGDVIGIFGDVELGARAEVSGQVFALGRLYQDDTAKVDGDVVVLNPPFLPNEFEGLDTFFRGGWLSFLARQVEFLLIALLVLLLLVILPERRLKSARQALSDHPGGCFGYGLLATLLGHVGLVVLFLVLVLTVIGIPLALLLVLGYIAFGLTAVTLAALQVGARACASLHISWRQPWTVALCGLALLHLISFLSSVLGLWPPLRPLAILFGVLGIAVKFLAFCYGVGAIVLSRLGSRQAADEPVEGMPRPAEV
jgi:hypothetical protein